MLTRLVVREEVLANPEVARDVVTGLVVSLAVVKGANDSQKNKLRITGVRNSDVHLLN